MRPPNEASEAELEALKYTESKVETPLEDHFSVLAVTSDPFENVPTLSRTHAELYFFDTDTEVFVIQEKEVDVDIAANGDYDGRSTTMNLIDISLDHRAATIDSIHVNAY